MHIEERVRAMVDDFTSFRDWEERYKHLLSLGKNLVEMPSEQKIEKNIVKGCQSQVWLYADFKDGKILFYADSDAAIAKGIVAILVDVYSASTPDEILETDKSWTDQIGLKQHLSMNRANGLASMLKQIYIYALAFKTKLRMSGSLNN